MLTLLFLLLFFGLLAAGMPIFLVLGMCAGILYIATGQPLIGAAQNTTATRQLKISTRRR